MCCEDASRPQGAMGISVRDDQGPRDAAIDYAERYETGEAVLLVSAERDPRVTRWRVEPVTTYRARPA